MHVFYTTVEQCNICYHFFSCLLSFVSFTCCSPTYRQQGSWHSLTHYLSYL